MYRVLLVFQCVHEHSDDRGENGDGEGGIEWRLLDPLYACMMCRKGRIKELMKEFSGCLAIWSGENGE